MMRTEDADKTGLFRSRWAGCPTKPYSTTATTVLPIVRKPNALLGSSNENCILLVLGGLEFIGLANRHDVIGSYRYY